MVIRDIRGPREVATVVAVPFGPAVGINAGFKVGVSADNWRIRGKYYDDYYKNTGKRPKYYNKLTRKRVKW